MKIKKHLALFTAILSLFALTACDNSEGPQRQIPGWDDTKQKGCSHSLFCLL